MERYPAFGELLPARLRHHQARPFHPVTWIDMRQPGSSGLHGAVEEMVAGAARGVERKAAAGLRGGRPLQNPGFHYTLFWQDPTDGGKREMRRAVAESLTVLGLDEHQAVLVGRGGPVPHVHVVVDRVSPRDGRAVPLGWTGLKLSRWTRRWAHFHTVGRLELAGAAYDDDPPPTAA